jgi:hypothetical protein
MPATGSISEPRAFQKANKSQEIELSPGNFKESFDAP